MTSTNGWSRAAWWIAVGYLAVAQSAQAFGADGAPPVAAPASSPSAAVAASANVATAAAVAPAASDVQQTLDTVIITSQRRREDAQKVPITVQAFGAKAIDALGIRSSTDLGAVTPNVSIALPSGAGAQPVITIRGIGLNDFNSNNAGPNGIYVDDVYISSPGAQTFQVFDLDRIEVLKGPQGTLYGRNTSGGAINFITAKPSAETSGQIKLGYSSFDTRSAEGAFGGQIVSGLNGRISFVKNKSTGYFDNTLTGAKENGSNDYALRAQLEYVPNDAVTLLGNVHGGRVDTRPTEYRHVGTLDPATGQPCSVGDTLGGKCVDAFGYGTPARFYSGAFDRQEHLKISSLGASARADVKSGDATFTSLTAFERNSKFHPEDTDASPNRLLEIDYGVHADTFTQELRVAGGSGPLHGVGGLYYLQERLYQDQPVRAFTDFDTFYGDGSGDGLAQIAYDKNRQITKSKAIFGQGDYAFASQWTLTLGARYTSERKTFDTAASAQYQSTGIDAYGPVVPLWTFDESTQDSKASGRAALAYALSSQVNAYGSIASGFKSGGFNGGFLSADPTEAKHQLGPVQPETVVTYELGLKSEFFDRRLLLNVAAFYNRYTDMQVFNQIPPVVSGGFDLEILTNAPKAHTRGIDLQMVAKPAAELTTTFNLGLLSTRIDTWNPDNGTGSTVDYTGNHLPLAPNVSLDLIVDWKHPLGDGVLDALVDTNYRSKQYFDVSDDPLITQARYWLVNVRSSYLFGQGQYEVALFARNLFNRKYLSDAIDLGNPFGLVQQVVGTPRSLGVQFTYNY